MRSNTILAVLVLATMAQAQGIQKWRTPDGRIVYGTSAPAGVTVLESYESAVPAAVSDEVEKPSGSDAPEKNDARFSTEVSLERRRIERRLNAAAENLRKIREQKKYVQNLRLTGSTDRLPSAQFAAEAANFGADKSSALAELKDAEVRQVAAMKNIRAEFGALHDRVNDHYGGHLPGWWRSLNCPAC